METNTQHDTGPANTLPAAYGLSEEGSFQLVTIWQSATQEQERSLYDLEIICDGSGCA